MNNLTELISCLTYAAELLSYVPTSAEASDGSTAVGLLLRLSHNESSVIREGAICGLSGHNLTPEIEARLKEMEETDPSENLRDAAKCCLAEFYS